MGISLLEHLWRYSSCTNKCFEKIIIDIEELSHVLFTLSTVVKNKSKMMDVGPLEWIQWRAFNENVSIIVFVFFLLFLLSFGFNFVSYSYIMMCCGISVQWQSEILCQGKSDSLCRWLGFSPISWRPWFQPLK